MMTRHFSSNRLFALIIAAVMMLFATPTPSIEGNVAESGRTATVVQGMEFLSHKSTVRKIASSADTIRFPAYLAAMSVLFASLLLATRRVQPAVPFVLHPLIARLMARITFLTTIVFNSQYV
ncbi:hypothetical protein [Paenibacillus sp. HJGM_3]|uniref:hypothetical protein n=1 Tax=Paenibacillus sp. HJGM_3 TaxID=3379816 RepID=UPI00385D83F2